MAVNFKIRFMIQTTPDFIRVAENVNAAPAKIIRGSAPIPQNAFKNVKHMVLAILTHLMSFSILTGHKENLFLLLTNHL